MSGRWAFQRLWRTSNRTIRARSATRSLHQFSGRHGFQSMPRKTVRIPQPQHLAINAPLGARTLFTTSIPSILVPPAIFIGLLLALWTWKCFWIVVLQDKLLYLSWLPPLSRSESVADYAGECRGVQWTEKRIRSLDGTKLAVCEGRLPILPDDQQRKRQGKKKKVVICYFQGNGGSTPLRLPLLSQVMKAIGEMAGASRADDGDVDVDVDYVVVALSYRGYWKSSGRATQTGIELDAQAFLSWVSESYGAPDTDLRVVLWGHSLGAAVASTATVKYLSGAPAQLSDGKDILQPPIAGLILEAPISSIKDMLISLYPQKWLPYRYLWPFSWNNWDVAAALERMACYQKENGYASDSGVSLKSPKPVPPIFLMSAENDEVIPLWVAEQLEDKAKSLGLSIERKDVKGAMHIEGPLKVDGRKALVNFILRASACK